MAEFITGTAARKQVSALLDQIDDAHARLRELSSDEVGTEFRVEMAERLESQGRGNRGLMYRVFGQIADPPDEAAMAPTAVDQLWARLRVPPNEIKPRMKVATRLRPRRQIAGPPLPPDLAQVATALFDGVIGEDHLKTITKAMDKLPSCVSVAERDEVEASLVREAIKSDAEIVTAAAKMIDAICNPDGDYDKRIASAATTASNLA